MEIGMASRRKNRLVTAREPNGRIQREEREPAPTEVRRIRDAALRGLRDPEWGSELGRLYLQGIITDSMYAAGKRWREHATEYRQAIGIFPVKSASLERGSHSTSADPDSDEGNKQAERERNAAERFMEAHAILVFMGQGTESIIRRLCEDDLSLAGMVELKKARYGLSRLADHYNLHGRLTSRSA